MGYVFPPTEEGQDLKSQKYLNMLQALNTTGDLFSTQTRVNGWI